MCTNECADKLVYSPDPTPDETHNFGSHGNQMALGTVAKVVSTSMPRIMPRASIACTLNTRFPLVKPIYRKEDVAGAVRLLRLSDAPRAAQVP